MPDDAIIYAKEVYAACATVGFDSADARHLKALLDEYDTGRTSAASGDLVTIAQQVQRASIEWINR